MKPWFIKNRPNKFTELYFTDSPNLKLLEWMNKATKGSILHLTGPTGCGKTSLVYAASRVLNLNVIEYETALDLNSINSSVNLRGLKSILLIDGEEISPKDIAIKFSKISIPVIITSSLFFKSIETIKILKPGADMILKAVKRVLKAEGFALDDRIILRISEQTNYDFRSVINYCQVLSRIPFEIRDLGVIERISEPSVFTTCKMLLSKRLTLVELDKIYTEKIQNLCINSLLENSSDLNVLKAIECRSEISMLPEKFRFLSLDTINKVQAEFVYKKEEAISTFGNRGQDDPLHFLPFYSQSSYNRRCADHFHSILKQYDKTEEYPIELTPIEIKAFKYKYRIGFSAAVKRDVTLKEIFDV